MSPRQRRMNLTRVLLEQLREGLALLACILLVAGLLAWGSIAALLLH